MVYIVFIDVKDHFISCSFITNINTKEVNKMADIKISNLSGLDLFNDSEDFMIEVDDNQLRILGGLGIELSCQYGANSCRSSDGVCREATHLVLQEFV
jgi:hypothetical protein